MPHSEESSASLVFLTALLFVLVLVKKLGTVDMNLAVPCFEYLDLCKNGRSRGTHGSVIAKVGSSPVKMKEIVTEYVMSE